MKTKTRPPTPDFAMREPEPRCPDCGERGELKGHMGCMFPSDEAPGHLEAPWWAAA